MKIVIPTRDSPGYLRRQKRALEYKARLKEQKLGNQDPALIDELADFLAPIALPDEPDAQKAKEWLMDNLSENQFDQIIEALTGGGKNTTVPPQSESPSSSTTSPE